MKSATGPFEGVDAYNDKWFQSAIKNVSGKKSNLFIICLILYNCVKFQQCISIFLYRKNLLQEIQQKRSSHLYNIYNLPFSID